MNKFIKKVRLMLERRTLGFSDQIFILKRLSFVLSSGIPLAQALELLHAQTTRVALRHLLQESSNSVREGEPLSTHWEKSNQFNITVVNMLKVGEANGNLDSAFSDSAMDLQKKLELKRKIIGALVYPFCICFATICVTLMLIVYVFPKVMPLFVSLKIELPLSTNIIIFLSECLERFGLFMVIGLFISIAASVYIYKKSKRVRIKLCSALVSLPIVGTLIKHFVLAEFCRTCGLLLSRHLVLPQVVHIATQTSSYELYAESLSGLVSETEGGGRMSEYLARFPRLFPSILVQMVAIGELSGSLSETLLYLAEYFESEVDETTRKLGTLIEPVLMIGVGLLVGFVAISILSPVYQITEHFKH